jgi:hypothetical protein
MCPHRPEPYSEIIMDFKIGDHVQVIYVRGFIPCSRVGSKGVVLSSRDKFNSNCATTGLPVVVDGYIVKFDSGAAYISHECLRLIMPDDGRKLVLWEDIPFNKKIKGEEVS